MKLTNLLRWSRERQISTLFVWKYRGETDTRDARRGCEGPQADGCHMIMFMFCAPLIRRKFPHACTWRIKTSALTQPAISSLVAIMRANK